MTPIRFIPAEVGNEKSQKRQYQGDGNISRKITRAWQQTKKISKKNKEEKGK